LRGRWKKRRTSDQYESTLLSYPDAHAAASLCTSGPIKYVLRRGTDVTDDWMDMNVCVNIVTNSHLDKPVSHVLVLSMLWCCFVPGQEHRSLSASRDRIRSAYGKLVGSPVDHDTPNPVRCVFLLISRNEDRLEIQEAYGEDEDRDDDAQTTSDSSTGSTSAAIQLVTQQVSSVNSNIHEVYREVMELNKELRDWKKIYISPLVIFARL